MPEAWNELSQEDLRYVLRLIWLYQEAYDWELRVKVAAFLHFAGVEVIRRTDQGWLCCESSTVKRFLLDTELMPSILKPLEWVSKAEAIDVRIEKVGEWRAVDFCLQTLPFGSYLKAENNYQAYLQTKREECLVNLARILYDAEEEEKYGEESVFRNEVLTGTFLWYNAAKQLLGRQFPNFLKQAGGEDEPVTRESLTESMRAQIRLLTKGDVTKQRYILEETDTWTALAELDALAKEAEEIQRKYGK